MTKDSCRMLSNPPPKSARFQVSYIFIIIILQSFPTTRFGSPRFRTLEHRHKVWLFVALLASSQRLRPKISHQHRWNLCFEKNTQKLRNSSKLKKKWLESWLIRVGLWIFCTSNAMKHISETHPGTSWVRGSPSSRVTFGWILIGNRQTSVTAQGAPNTRPSPISFLQNMNQSRACSRILLSSFLLTFGKHSSHHGFPHQLSPVNRNTQALMSSSRGRMGLLAKLTDHVLSLPING